MELDLLDIPRVQINYGLKYFTFFLYIYALTMFFSASYGFLLTINLLRFTSAPRGRNTQNRQV